MADLSDSDLERVTDLVRTVAIEELMPRFRNLADHEVREKSPGDLVTVADLASEQRLADGLARIVPGVPVVGEEAVASDPSILDHLGRSDCAWLVDPLDGTNNFAAGNDRFAIIVGYVRRGQTVASWIYTPASARMAVATRGGGALLEGLRVKLDETRSVSRMTGSVGYKFIKAFRAAAPTAAGRVGELGTLRCAGLEYVSLLAGARHFSLYRMTKPWDHAAGALLVEEAGGVSRRFDGAAYSPLQALDAGILAAPSVAAWSELHQLLVAPALPMFERS